MKKLLTLALAMGWLVQPSFGQQNSVSEPSENLSRPAPEKEFYAPWSGQCQAQDGLLDCAGRDKASSPDVTPPAATSEPAEEVPPVLEEARNDEDNTAANGKAADESYRFAVRANLLRWVTLTPDLGIEWRITPCVGIAVNGSWTAWKWKDNDRQYGLWEVAPEVRWYLGRQKRAYVGAQFKTGEFNYKLSSTGRQGDLLGGGITGGYQLPLCPNLTMDFSLGIGYLKADYDTYTVVNGVCVHQNSKSKNWWGPINAGVSLVWKLF